MYSYEGIIRYSETGGSTVANASTIANYLQDCAILHSEELGVGVEYLLEHDRAWFLISWQICVERYPKLKEKVTIKTWPYEFKGFLGYRNIVMCDEAGNEIVKAASIWSFMDLKNLKPVRPEQNIIDAYPLSPKLDMEYGSRKLKIIEGAQLLDERRVMKYQIDSNNHMNNGAYISLAMEYMDPNILIKTIKTENKKQFVKDEIILVKYVHQENVHQYLLCDEKEDVRCIVIFEE